MNPENSPFNTPFKNQSLASTGQNFNYSKTYTNINLPSHSHILEENGMNSRFNSLENLSMMDDEPASHEMKEYNLMLLMQKSICYLANKYNTQSRRIRELKLLNEKKERQNNLKEKKLVGQKKRVVEKLKVKKKEKEKVKRIKEQQRVSLQEEIERISYESSLLDKEIQSLLPESQKSHQSRPQQPIIIVVPSFPPQQPIHPYHQPQQHPNPQNAHYYPQQPFVVQNKPSVDRSSTNPMHHLMRVTPPKQQMKGERKESGNLLMGENFGDIIAKGMMQQQVASKNVSEKTSERSSHKLKISAKQINLFKKESRNKIRASGNWEVDEEDNYLNDALSQSLEKSGNIQRTKTTPALKKPEFLESKVVIDVEESISKNSNIYLSPGKGKQKQQLKQSAVRLSLPQDQVSRQISNKSSSQEIQQPTNNPYTNLRKVQSPPAIRKVDSSIEEGGEMNQNKFKKKTESSIIELDIPDNMEISNMGYKNESPAYQKSSPSKESKRIKSEKKEDPIVEQNLVLGLGQIKKSQLPPHPPPKEEKKSSKVDREAYQSVQIETKKSGVQKKSSVNRSEGNAKTPTSGIDSDHSFDDLNDINLLAVSKISKNKPESYLSMKSKIRGTQSKVEEERNEEKQAQNRHSYPQK